MERPFQFYSLSFVNVSPCAGVMVGSSIILLIVVGNWVILRILLHSFPRSKSLLAGRGIDAGLSAGSVLACLLGRHKPALHASEFHSRWIQRTVIFCYFFIRFLNTLFQWRLTYHWWSAIFLMYSNLPNY